MEALILSDAPLLALPAGDGFHFEKLLFSSLERKASLGDDTDDEGGFFGPSPLSSPGQTPAGGVTDLPLSPHLPHVTPLAHARSASTTSDPAPTPHASPSTSLANPPPKDASARKKKSKSRISREKKRRTETANPGPGIANPAPTPHPPPSASPANLPPDSAPAPKKQSKSHVSRAKKRKAEKANLTPDDYEVRSGTRRKHTSGAHGVTTTLKSEEARVARTGYVGIRGPKPSASAYGLEQLVGLGSEFGFDLVEWDGRTAVAILDSKGRVVAVLVGRPDDPSWEQVHQDAADRLESAREECVFSEKQREHRRGRFPALATGISHGGGQVRPGNLVNGANDGVLKALTHDPAFIRLAGFASGAFANWAPRLYGYYSEHLESLLKHDGKLLRPFPNSMWAAATFNFGPATTCSAHTDSANLTFGWCGITALGNFDPKRGGHLVLWEARRVIEFPPGSTILIPSATLTHSNVPIQAGERRYSFTQYTAGAIFRWVDCSFQAVTRHRAGLTKREREREARELEGQLQMGLGLFSTLEELKKLRRTRAATSSQDCT